VVSAGIRGVAANKKYADYFCIWTNSCWFVHGLQVHFSYKIYHNIKFFVGLHGDETLNTFCLWKHHVNLLLQSFRSVSPDLHHSSTDEDPGLRQVESFAVINLRNKKYYIITLFKIANVFFQTNDKPCTAQPRTQDLRRDPGNEVVYSIHVRVAIRTKIGTLGVHVSARRNSWLLWKKLHSQLLSKHLYFEVTIQPAAGYLVTAGYIVTKKKKAKSDKTQPDPDCVSLSTCSAYTGYSNGKLGKS
jgi:hypothetical protein